MARVLLDTCAAIWIGNGQPIADTAWDAITAAALDSAAYISPVSAWEIGLLSRPRRNPERALVFRPDVKSWFSRLLSGGPFTLAPFTPDIAMDSSLLPGSFHNDPMDRLLIATARHMDVAILTRDTAILDYAATGHVKATAC